MVLCIKWNKRKGEKDGFTDSGSLLSPKHMIYSLVMEVSWTTSVFPGCFCLVILTYFTTPPLVFSRLFNGTSRQINVLKFSGEMVDTFYFVFTSLQSFEKYHHSPQPTDPILPNTGAIPIVLTFTFWLNIHRNLHSFVLHRPSNLRSPLRHSLSLFSFY